MAFIDKIGKTISTAGEGVVGKGRAWADVARLNAAVSEEEKKINNAYFQIGKLYVALHPQDYEADFGNLIDSILVSQEKIKLTKQQIQDIKGVIRCENCGAEMPNNIAFCSACGTPMPKAEAVLDENHVKCDKCGSIIEKNMRFCTTCGNSLVKPVQANNPSPEVPANGILCPQCGIAIRDGLKFCTSCGFSLENDAKEADNVEDSSTQENNDSSTSPERECPSCGALADGEMAFCVECGTKLN